MENLYCYKMTWDTEFAPNPHHGVLTLANCKPRIRRYAKVGDWISGWTSTYMHDKNNKVRRFVNGEEKMLYIARVTKKITYDEYWRDYEEKRPHVIDENAKRTSKYGLYLKYDSGDNIYEPIGNGEYVQHENSSHTQDDMKHDLKGEHVLVCEEFYYFGIDHPLDVDVPFRIPRCKKVSLDEYRYIIDGIKEKYNVGINQHK